ncbi:MAG: DUF7619 domain-containing protein [Aureispira sp.]
MSTKFIHLLLLGFLLFGGTVYAQQWTRVIDPPPTPIYSNGSLSGEDVQPTSDGGYLMVGIESLPTGAVRDFPLMTKVDAQGYIEWQRHYFRDMGPTSIGYFNAVALLVGAGDTAVVAGSSPSNGVLVTQIDAQGDTIWRRNFLSNCGCTANKLSMQMVANGEYVLAIATTALVGGSTQTVLLQINKAGVVVNQSTQASFWAEDIRNTFDGGYILAGKNNNIPALQKLDAQWNTEWTEAYVGLINTGLHSVVQATDSGYVVATELNGVVGLTPRLFKVDATGQTIEWELDTLVSTVSIGLTGQSYHVIRTATGNLMYVASLYDSRSMAPTVYFFKVVVAEISPTGQIVDYTLLDPGQATEGKRIREVGPQEFIMVGSYTNSRGYLVKFGQAGPAPHQLRGHFYVEANSNCTLDTMERKLGNWILRATEQQTGQSYYANTDQNGAYQIDLPVGQYTIEGVLPNGVWVPCAPALALTASSGGRDTADFGFSTTFSCPHLTVDVSTPYVAACDTIVYTVNYCNNGSTTAIQPVVTLQIDTSMAWLSATVPTTALPSPGYYQATLGNLAPGQCATFEFTVGVPCQIPAWEWFCVQADIMPDTLCGGQFLGWDGSSIAINSTCVGDSIIYWLYNIGAGNMSSARNYLVTEDHIMLRTGNYQLGAGDSIRLVIPVKTGATYYLQAEQDGMHPFSAFVSTGVAHCSDVTLSTPNGLPFAQYPEDDAAPTRSIDCQSIQGNDSSNYKRVAPVGFGATHLIEREVDLEYQLRFQNTTGSVLQQVILVDTLAAELSPSTLVMGASSHPYTWSLTGTGILTIIMDNIYVDTLEWGFVKFKIAQQPNLTLGSVIYNSASISLGGRLLDGTNTTFHTIDEDFIPTNITKRRLNHLQWRIYPNPFNTQVTFALEEGTVPSFEVHIHDALGREVGRVQSVTGEAIQWNATALPAGVYVYQVLVKGALMGTGKIVAAPQ